MHILGIKIIYLLQPNKWEKYIMFLKISKIEYWFKIQQGKLGNIRAATIFKLIRQVGRASRSEHSACSEKKLQYFFTQHPPPPQRFYIFYHRKLRK